MILVLVSLYLPFGLEDLYSSILATTTQHRPDNDQVKNDYLESPFFVKCLLTFGLFPNRSGTFKEGTSHPKSPTISPLAQSHGRKEGPSAPGSPSSAGPAAPQAAA